MNGRLLPAANGPSVWPWRHPPPEAVTLPKGEHEEVDDRERRCEHRQCEGPHHRGPHTSGGWSQGPGAAGLGLLCRSRARCPERCRPAVWLPVLPAVSCVFGKPRRMPCAISLATASGGERQPDSRCRHRHFCARWDCARLCAGTCWWSKQGGHGSATSNCQTWWCFRDSAPAVRCADLRRIARDGECSTWNIATADCGFRIRCRRVFHVEQRHWRRSGRSQVAHCSTWNMDDPPIQNQKWRHPW